MRNVGQNADPISPTQQLLEKLVNAQVPLNTRLKEFLQNIASLSSKSAEDCWTTIKIINFLLSLDDPEANELRYEALDSLSQRAGKIKLPQAKHLLYCIGIEYAHRFTGRKDLQKSLFSLITSSLKANDTILAVIMGDMAELRKLPLSSLAYPQKLTLPPLSLFATANNQVDVIKFLRAKGQPISLFELGFNPLMHAAARGMNDLIPILLCYESPFTYLKPDFDPKFIPKDQYWLYPLEYMLERGLITPLAAAAAYGHVETVKLFIQTLTISPEVKVKAIGPSILYAARARHFAVVEYLLDQFKLEKGDLSEWLTPTLTEAIKGNKEDLIQRLLKLGVSINRSAHQAAVIHNHLEVFQKSIRGNSSDEMLRDFCWAICHNSRNILSCILEKTPIDKWNSLFHSAISSMVGMVGNERNNIKLALSFLKEKGVDLNSRGEKGNTVLMSKVISGDYNFVGLLCELEADPSLRNDEGLNAFNVCPDIDFATDLVPLTSNSPPPFSLKQLQDFFMKAQLGGDLESIQRFLLKILQNEFVLFTEINNSEKELSPNLSFFEKIVFQAKELIKSFEQVQFTGPKEISSQIQEALRALSFLCLFQKLKSSIRQTQNAEAQAAQDARGHISTYLLELASLDPLWLSSDLPRLFDFIIEIKAKVAYQFVLSYFLALEKSELKSNLCHTIGEILYRLQYQDSETWGDTKCQAYIFYREAAIEIEDARGCATSTLAELLGIEISTTAALEDLKELAGVKRFEEVMSRVAKEEAALSSSNQGKSNNQLLICAARNGNLKMIEQLFAKGGFNFNEITDVFFQSIDTAINAGHLNCSAYFVCNMARDIIEQKLYRAGDFTVIQRLLPYVTRNAIPIEQMDDKAFAQLYNALKRKETLSQTLGIVHFFNTNQVQVAISHQNSPRSLNFILGNIKLLEKYIGENIGSIVNEYITAVQPYITAIICLANFQNQAHRANETLKNIINILITALSGSSKRTHQCYATLLNEYIQEESYRDRQRLFLFNKILGTEFNSLDQMIMAKPLQTLLNNLCVQAEVIRLFGMTDIRDLFNQLFSQGKADLPSSEFWDLYALIKKRLQEFSSRNICYGFALFSEIDSRCLVQIIRLQQAQLEHNKSAQEPAQKRAKPESPPLSRPGSPTLFAPVKEEKNSKENRKRAPEAELESKEGKQVKMDGH